MISGLTLDRNRRALAQRYLAAIQSIAYGTRHIIEVMNQSGHKISKISMCGGSIENSLLLRELADITGCVISIPSEPEAVLLGCAILAAAACDEFPTVTEAMATMSSVSHTIKPRVGFKEFHEKKYRVFHEMYKDQLKYNNIMQKELL
jgi:ribulose kinase